ncbi:MAG: hypothetical protein WAN11_15810 [Syntrophobacteraceae bacterium]
MDIESRVLRVARLKKGLSTTHPLRPDEIKIAKTWLGNPSMTALGRLMHKHFPPRWNSTDAGISSRSSRISVIPVSNRKKHVGYYRTGSTSALRHAELIFKSPCDRSTSRCGPA